MCNYQAFITDYNNPNITAHEVRRKHNLNSKQYSNIRKLAIHNGDIPPVRHMNNTGAKFYNRNGKGYEVHKTINGEKIYVGKFPTEEVAKEVVGLCIEHNWQVNEIQAYIDEVKCRPKNYTIINGYYIIQKSVNGANKVFCTIHQSKISEDDIKAMVDLFRSLSWNINCKDYVLSKFNVS